MKLTLLTTFAFGIAWNGLAQDTKESKSEPVELEVIEASVGVWDAEIEVWPQGPEAASMKFNGVETNRPYGEYWISSDFDSEINGQVMKVHSIVGYDLDLGKLVGKVIDHGPYAAKMTGEYDEKSKTIHWTTKVKNPDGSPVVQKTSVTQKSADERLLTLSVPNKEKDGFTKFMEIKFVRRK